VLNYFPNSIGYQLKMAYQYFNIISKKSGKVLDVKNGAITDNAEIVQYTKSGGDNQKWRLEPDISEVLKNETTNSLDISGSVLTSTVNGASATLDLGSIILDQRVGIIEPLDSDRHRNTWHKVTFSVPFPQGKKVVVIPMTQTYFGNNTPGLRLQNVTNSGFEIRFDELVGLGNLSDGYHVQETVGWVAYGF
jgi:hypothetical protein